MAAKIPTDIQHKTSNAECVNDQIASIEVEFLNTYFEQFKAAMTEKYGKPSKEETKRFQNSFGQTFVGSSLYWNGKSVTLSLDEHSSGNKEWGYIVMSSRTYLRKLNDWFSKKKDAIKTGL